MYKKIDISKESPESKLCYVENRGYDNETEGQETLRIRLFFTDIPLSEQCGDDWDDTPYEHNAGEPYDDFWSNGKLVNHTIYVTDVIISANDWRQSIRFPSDYGYNSPFCVDDINSGAVAWLYRRNVSGKCNGRSLHAGASPKDTYEFLKDVFIECVKEEEER